MTNQKSINKMLKKMNCKRETYKQYGKSINIPYLFIIVSIILLCLPFTNWLIPLIKKPFNRFSFKLWVHKKDI